MAGAVHQFKDKAVRVADSLLNFMSGLGTGKDPTTYGRYTVTNLTRDQLENAYRADWVARKTINLPADDATREWRDWQADGKQIEALENIEAIFNLQNRVRLAMIKARLYGGAAIVMGLDQGNSFDELNLDAVKKDSLRYLHVLSSEELGTGPLVNDIQSPFYCEPSYYETRGARVIKIHPSRVVRFIGAEQPDPRTGGNKGWGDSILQIVDDAIKDVGLVSGGIAAMVNDGKLDVISIPDLAESLATQEYADKMTKRFTYANTAKSMINALVLDDKEKWQRVSTNFSSLPDILRLYLLIASAAADIPATRMLGQSPAGLSATGESDTRNYYDRIASEQRTVVTPAMARLDEVLIRSALGARDPNIHYIWAPLWQMDEKQRAEISKSKADAFKVDVDAGVVPIEVLRKGRLNQLIEDGIYPGLDAALADFEQKNAAAALTANELGEVVNPGGDVQAQAFNGAQITAVKDIVAAVVSGDMPADTAIRLIMIGFPTVKEDDAKAIIDPIATMVKKKVEPAPIADPNAPPVPQPRPRLAIVNKTTDQVIQDAEPRTLYVHRDVVNAAAIIKWAKEQGFETTQPAEAMHVTIAFSKAPIDWMKIGEDWQGGGDPKGRLTLRPGGVRLVEALGDADEAVCLLFTSSELTWRWRQIREAGADWKWGDDYQPHITITLNKPAALDLKTVEPYRGEIVLGPEIFEEIVPQAQENVEEVTT